ncbi:hypothetical protein [Streptomyces sp. HUAS TT20]|uniref:hypothetical protein n=1 Tax=Streptomyces sp. HUAS TT20 TaxID=3447509 RepID=UPI0021D98F3A|nr:hypothetical protein [Streptomyces sp. HUAS 15-9]UXY29567.1 hypothetical protein N8I87_25440 [Streptomyces sp. HUAS 15-9]
MKKATARCAARVGAIAVLAAAVLAGTPAEALPDDNAPRLTYFGPRPKITVGGDVEFHAWNVPAGTDKVVVSSPALDEPIQLVPAKDAQGLFVEKDATPVPGTRDDIDPGTYPVTAKAGGRVIATTRLVVVPRFSTPARRFVIYPKDAPACNDTPTFVRPGSDAYVVLTLEPTVMDKGILTVTSQAFRHDVHLKEGGVGLERCLADDGSTVYQGRAQVRDDLPPGEYDMALSGRFGRRTITQKVSVAGQAVAHDAASAVSWPAVGGTAAGAVLIAASGFVVWRRRRKTAVSS